MHVMLDVIRPFLLLKAYVGMPRPMSSYHLCILLEMNSCHARRRPIVCVVKRRDGINLPMFSDQVCCPRAMIASNARCRVDVCDLQGR